MAKRDQRMPEYVDWEKIDKKWNNEEKTEIQNLLNNKHIFSLCLKYSQKALNNKSHGLLAYAIYKQRKNKYVEDQKAKVEEDVAKEQFKSSAATDNTIKDYINDAVRALRTVVEQASAAEVKAAKQYKYEDIEKAANLGAKKFIYTAGISLLLGFGSSLLANQCSNNNLTEKYDTLEQEIHKIQNQISNQTVDTLTLQE